jgi:HSP20 family protein
MDREIPDAEPLHPAHRSPDEMQFMDTGSSHWRVTLRSHVWRPPTDVYETENEIVVRVEIAGMKEEDFSIELNDRYLSIHGARPDVPERRAFHQMEIRFGEFNTEVELASPVIADRVEAVYRDGFLRVVLPKAQARKIQIEE